MHFGTSLACQWLGLHLPVQWGTGSIPGRGAKIPHTLQPKNQDMKQKHYYNKFKKRLLKVFFKKSL